MGADSLSCACFEVGIPEHEPGGEGVSVVFATGTNQAIPGAELHASFKLKAGGRLPGVAETEWDCGTQFSPAYPEQFADISYGTEQIVTTNTLVAAGGALRYLIPTSSATGSDVDANGLQ